MSSIYAGELTGIPMGEARQLLNTSHTITAEVEIPEPRALGLGAPQQAGDGMIATHGGRFAGRGFYILKGKPVYVWKLLDLKRVRWEGPEALAGWHTLEFDFKYDGLGFATLAFNSMSGIGRGGTGLLKVDGRVVATQTMERTIPLILRGMRPSTSVPTRALLSITATTRCLSASPASSTRWPPSGCSRAP
jgi:arylsulfatase